MYEDVDDVAAVTELGSECALGHSFSSKDENFDYRLDVSELDGPTIS